MPAPAPTTGVYSYAQLEGLWDNAGGPPAVAPTAAAVAEAESSGKADALNPDDNNGTQSSFGLWQLSNGTHTPPSPDWANPAVNAQLAVQKYTASGWAPWGTYDSGAYLQYLQPNVKPDKNVAKPAGGTPATTTADWWLYLNPANWPALAGQQAASAAAGALAPVGKSIGKYIADGVLVIAGLALVVWGVGRSTGAGRKAEQVTEKVTQVAPAAALAAA